MKIGITELVLIFVVALFVLGPDKLPYYARKLGEALAQFRKFSGEMAEDIKESVVEPLEEVQRPLREAVEPLTEIDQAVRGNVKDVQSAFSGIGKTPPKKKPEKPVSVQEEPAAGEDEARDVPPARQEPSEPLETSEPSGPVPESPEPEREDGPEAFDGEKPQNENEEERIA